VSAAKRMLPRTILDPVFWLRMALVFVAAFAFTRGWRYTMGREPVPMAIELITSGISVLVYGIAWFAACAMALLSIPKAWPGGSFPTIVLSLAFAFGFTISWLVALDSPPGSPGQTDYANASTYWTVLGLLTCGYFLSRAALKGSPLPEMR
jgi:hypothetical protein